MINDLLKNDEVKYTFSYMAKTNNGVLALMDIKEFNIDRLKAFHGIISDGVHKVELTEEYVKTLFIGLVNPEDTVHYEKVQSFQDRIINVKIPYILDYNTEVSIYKNKFSDKIGTRFLPGVLENFAKIIIATRLEHESPALKKWIFKPEVYSKYLDKSMYLLKMQIYIGKIPDWLTEEDIKKFDRKTRKDVLAASDFEGRKGISGRRSLNVFNDFYSKYYHSERLITVEDVKEYFTNKKDELVLDIPTDFIDKLIDLYDYEVLQQVKESIYFYNEQQITSEILNYLFAINFEIGDEKKNDATGETLEITEEFLQNFEKRILGLLATPLSRKNLRKEIQAEYISQTLSQEVRVQGKQVSDTKQFKSLFEKYTKNLKENELSPYIDNDNFRRGIMDFDNPSFNTYDERIRRDVTMLINNLISKFNYNNNGAKQVSLYVLEKKLVGKY
jgi:predicted Ser/Thr protein kinase